jgi:hypothetical protein
MVVQKKRKHQSKSDLARLSGQRHAPGLHPYSRARHRYNALAGNARRTGKDEAMIDMGVIPKPYYKLRY